MSSLVFVYGSLKKGFHNHHLLEKSRFLCENSLAGYLMISLGAFPGIIPNPGQFTPVYGEVYEVDEKTLKALDRLEGHPHMYERTLVKLNYGEEAWVYVYKHADTKFSKTVPTGCWGDIEKRFGDTCR